MDELALLRPKLARLKLSGMQDTLSERLSQALAEKWSYTQFLDTLLTRRGRTARLQAARAPTHQERSVSGQDPGDLRLLVQSAHPRADLRELATCRFVKSHAAQALGHSACRKGYEVTYERTSVLLDWKIRSAMGWALTYKSPCPVGSSGDTKPPQASISSRRRSNKSERM